MAVLTKCSSCGCTIDLNSPDVGHVIAKGDRFFHAGCIEVHNEKYTIGTPAYHIPRSW